MTHETNLNRICFRCIFSWIFLSLGRLYYVVFSSFMPLVMLPVDHVSNHYRVAIALIKSWSRVRESGRHVHIRSHPDYTFLQRYSAVAAPIPVEYTRRSCLFYPRLSFPLYPARPSHRLLLSHLFCFAPDRKCCASLHLSTPPHVLHVLTCEALVSTDEDIPLIFILGRLGYRTVPS